jgi:predicted metal-dependent hydrolase
LHQHSNGAIDQGKLVGQTCSAKFYKLIPLDLEKTPYVILISKGIHTHHPPPPSNVPLEIMEKLKEMLKVASEELVDITARKLISSM